MAQPHAFLGKIVSREEAARRVAGLPQPVVFTNGVFDVMHRGHVTYLAQARALGGSLVVALNTDASARRLGKGPDRPLNNEQDRAIMMAALACVDLVTWFDEDTPVELLGELRPAVYVKGGDYTLETIDQNERRAVEEGGGRISFLAFVPGKSTTGLLEKIQRL